MTAQNPMALETEFKIPLVMFVFVGVIVVDSFYAVSAMLSFYLVAKVYKRQKYFTVLDILKLYLKRVLRFLPLAYFTFFFGTYVMPHLHQYGDGKTKPIWYSFQELVFYRCTEPDIMLSKLLFFSNFYPSYQSDINACMPWSWSYEQDIQLFLVVPFAVMLYFKVGRIASYLLWTLIMSLSIFLVFKISFHYSFTAGVFSIENAKAFSYFYVKPWCRLPNFSLGVLSAMFFIDIRDYQRGIKEG